MLSWSSWCCHVQAVQLRVGLMTSLGLSFSRMLLMIAGSLRGQQADMRKSLAQHLAHSRRSAIMFLLHGHGLKLQASDNCHSLQGCGRTRWDLILENACAESGRQKPLFSSCFKMTTLHMASPAAHCYTCNPNGSH